MAVLYKRPDSLSLSGNLHPFEMTSANNVRFKLFKGETLLLNHSYAPGEDNRVVIDVRQVIESNLAFTLQAGETSYLQPNLAANFKVEIDDEEYSFRVIRSGVANLADTAYNWLKLHFLTWQPAEKKVTYYSPEWLTYYAVDDCSIKIHAYFDDGTDEEKVLLKCTEGNAYTVDVQYACMARLFNNKLPMYYDVSAYFGVGQIIRSEIQRYLADSARSEDEEWISWENSLGGYDTARVYGTNAFTGEHTHNISSVNDISNEYDIETKRKYSKNTGHINKYERRWLLDFFPAQVKYIHTGDTLRRIVVTEDNVTYKSSDLPSSYTFTYQYAESKPYLNLQKQENLPAGITIPIPNLPDFTLPPRIIEYPRIPLSEGVLFPVQDPNSERLGITTLGELKKLIGIEESPTLDGYATETWVTTHINNLINGAPAAFDTLKEIADVLQGNVSSIGDILTALGTKWTQDNTKISNWDTAYSWGNHASAGYLAKSLFDELFEKVAVGDTFQIKAKYSFYSVGSVAARKIGGSQSGSYGSLGSLTNVGSWADTTPTASRIMVQLAGATHWSAKLLSEVVGLDTTALATYLTNNGYYNSTNSNLSTVDWNAADLYVSKQLKLYTSTPANHAYIKQLNVTDNISIMELGTCYGYNTPVKAILLYNGELSAFNNTFFGEIDRNTNCTIKSSLSENGLLRLKSASTESSIGYYQNDNAVWTVGKGAGGGAGLDFGWWSNLPSKTAMKLSPGGTLSVYPTTVNYTEGIRIANSSNNWSLILFGAVGDENTSANAWMIGKNDANELIFDRNHSMGALANGMTLDTIGSLSVKHNIVANNGYVITNSGWFQNSISGAGLYNLVEDARWYASVGRWRADKPIETTGYLNAARIFAGYDSEVAGSISCSNWFRSSGDTGWYSSTYSGGWHMKDSTYIRTYGEKSIFTGAGYYLAAGTNEPFNSATILSGGKYRVGHTIISANNCTPILSWSNEIAGQGYKCRMGIGSYRQPTSWGRMYFSIGTNDAGTNSITHYMDASGLYVTGVVNSNTLYVSNTSVLGSTTITGELQINGNAHNTGWWYSVGTGGWFNETYAGGIHMTDTTWVRVYNGKAFYVANSGPDAIHTAGGVNASGRVFAGGNIDGNLVTSRTWLYSTGGTGWYNATYDGGMYMTDAEQVKVYNNKVLYNDGYRVWGIGGHNVGLKLYNPNHIGLNLATNSYTWGIYSNLDGLLRFGRRNGDVNDYSGEYALTIGGNGGTMIYNGNFYATGSNAAKYLSDIRLKENFKPIENAIGIIKQLRPFYHTWKQVAYQLNPRLSRSAEMGLSAQEVQELMPSAVCEMYGQYLGIDYSKPMPLIIAAIQELSSWKDEKDIQIEKLQREVETLNGKLNKIKDGKNTGK